MNDGPAAIVFSKIANMVCCDIIVSIRDNLISFVAVFTKGVKISFRFLKNEENKTTSVSKYIQIPSDNE